MNQIPPPSTFVHSVRSGTVQKRSTPFLVVPSLIDMSDTRIKFTSLGTVILDEIHFPSGEVVRDVIGGSGTYGPREIHSHPHCTFLLLSFKHLPRCDLMILTNFHQELLALGFSIPHQHLSQLDGLSEWAETFPLQPGPRWRVGALRWYIPKNRAVQVLGL